MIKKKAVVVLGPTSSGKTALAVKLAYQFAGEIISADSRQVYIGMDIGTGKDLTEYKFKDAKGKAVKINYHLIDVIDPKKIFSLSNYLVQANQALLNISGRDKLPLIVGGTGLYLQALVDNFQLSISKPNDKLRKELEGLTSEEIFKKLKKKYFVFADKLNNSERNNKRRLIRYFEILKDKGKINQQQKHPKFEFLILGLDKPRSELRDGIEARLKQRLENENMIEEVAGLKKQGLTWKRLESFGLEYKYISYYLQEKLSYEEMFEKLNTAIGRFAKKQGSWFRRWEKQGKKIYWVDNQEEAAKEIKKFLK